MITDLILMVWEGVRVARTFYRCTEKKLIFQVIKGKSQTPDFGDKQLLALCAAQ